MARIKKMRIKNFRKIKSLTWRPNDGVNCLIGPQDSGKTTLLDAIGCCLGSGKSMQFSDVDFHLTNYKNPIIIRITLGDLDSEIEDDENCKGFIRHFDLLAGKFTGIPSKNTCASLTIQLKVNSDLKPIWSLISNKRSRQDIHNKVINHIARYFPKHIGVDLGQDLSWEQGHALDKIAENIPESYDVFLRTARESRERYPGHAGEDLGGTISIVNMDSKNLGIDIKSTATTMLNAPSMSEILRGSILHDGNKIPLKNLGAGSVRLLGASLQKQTAKQSKIVLIDQLEHGLGPQRIIRFIDSFDAKKNLPPTQVFMTTHSPIAIRELSSKQIFVFRNKSTKTQIINLGGETEHQGIIRSFPEAFFAKSVIICEGASEIGLIRGIDQYRSTFQKPSIFSQGVGLSNAGGFKKIYKYLDPFSRLGYRTAVLRDNDCDPDIEMEGRLENNGGKIFCWRSGFSLEEELFMSLPVDAVHYLIKCAIKFHSRELIEDHIKSATDGEETLEDFLSHEKFKINGGKAARGILAKASKRNKKSWFKTIGRMEEVGRNVVGPYLQESQDSLKNTIEDIFSWCEE